MNLNKKLGFGVVILGLCGATVVGLYEIKLHQKPKFTHYSIEPSICRAGESKPIQVFSNFSDGSLIKEDPKDYEINYEEGSETAKKLQIEEMLDTVFINCYVAGTYPIKAQLNKDGEEKEIKGQIKVLAGEQESIVKISGDKQEGLVAHSLKDPLVAKVTDHWGNAVANVPVFVDTKEGEALASNFESNEDGLVSIPFKLGKHKGFHKFSLKAKADNKQEISVDFALQANAGEANKLIFTEDLMSEVEAGQVFPIAPMIAISDEFNNALDKTLKGVDLKPYLDPECTKIANLKEFLFKKKSSKKGLVRFDGVKNLRANTLYLGSSVGKLKVCSNEIKVVPTLAKSMFLKSSPSTEAEAGEILEKGPILGFKDQFGDITTKVKSDLDVKAFKDSKCKIAAQGNLSFSDLRVESGTLSVKDIKYTKAESLFLKISSKNLGELCIGKIDFLNSKADHISLVSGNDQTKIVNTSLNPIKIKVSDVYENPVPSFKVNVDYQGKPVSSSVSDESGIATIYIQLDQIKGEKDIKVYSDLLSSKNQNNIQIKAQAQASNPSKIVLINEPSPEVKAGEPLTISPKIQIKDKYDNLVDRANNLVSLGVFKDKECIVCCI